mgnify:CR=1 FL=1
MQLCLAEHARGHAAGVLPRGVLGPAAGEVGELAGVLVGVEVVLAVGVLVPGVGDTAGWTIAELSTKVVGEI